MKCQSCVFTNTNTIFSTEVISFIEAHNIDKPELWEMTSRFKEPNWTKLSSNVIKNYALWTRPGVDKVKPKV